MAAVATAVGSLRMSTTTTITIFIRYFYFSKVNQKTNSLIQANVRNGRGNSKHVHNNNKKLGNRESNRRFFSLSKETNRGIDNTKAKRKIVKEERENFERNL